VRHGSGIGGSREWKNVSRGRLEAEKEERVKDVGRGVGIPVCWSMFLADRHHKKKSCTSTKPSHRAADVHGRREKGRSLQNAQKRKDSTVGRGGQNAKGGFNDVLFNKTAA